VPFGVLDFTHTDRVDLFHRIRAMTVNAPQVYQKEDDGPE